MKTEIDAIVNALNDYNSKLPPAQLEAVKPAMEQISKNLNSAAFTSDVLSCLVSDLQDLNIPAVNELFAKYAISVEKSEKFLEMYATIQALIKKAQENRNGQTPQV